MISEAPPARTLDVVWYLVSRIAALALAITIVGLVVASAEHQRVAERQALIAHRADLAARSKKPKPTVRPAEDGVSRSKYLGGSKSSISEIRELMGDQRFMSGSKSGFGGLGIRRK